MCCFSGPVKVADTSIFARAGAQGAQYLVYAMQFQAGAEVAMILPLPVPKGSADDAVKFINLERYPKFFDDLERGFPAPKRGRGGFGGGNFSAAKPTLQVVEVGSFKASFVPTVGDFARLDPQFRLPEGVWESLPAYQDFGFAVFELNHKTQKAHPMAFEFPRRDPRKLFFPTVHIHDGKVYPKAKFDHMLYCQGDSVDPSELMDWEESPRLAGFFMRFPAKQSLMHLGGHCYRRRVGGEQDNTDILV